jgi:hypothetical protein
MSISLSESLVSLIEATRLIPGRPHISSLHRWRTRGVRNVRLETTVVGGRRYTSREAIERFIDRSTAAANHAPSSQTTVQSRRAAEQAARELADDGI